MCSDVRPDGWRRVTPFQIFEFQLHGCGEGRHREIEGEREREGGGGGGRGREGGRERERVREGGKGGGRERGESSNSQEDVKAGRSATERGNSAEL